MSSREKLLLNATTIDSTGHQKAAQALLIAEGCIRWCGGMDALPIEYQSFLSQASSDSSVVLNGLLGLPIEVRDCGGHLITPGFIDCHTHLVYAGDRADEFKQRLEGASYADIAKSGGGILSTVRSTRAASAEELLQQSLPRILAMRAEGVTTVEIKSGYGLDLANELKILQVARQLGGMSGVSVKTTFLGAHAIPVEYTGRNQAYVDFLCAEVMPAVASAGLADAVDVFCETIAFSLAQTEQLFDCATALGLPIKCHAEQLSNLGASSLAAHYKALSCDHLEHLDAAGAKAMADANTVAVILPGAYYFLRETHKPPIDILRHAGVKIAIATDCNPGTSPTTSLRLVMNMACQFFSLTVPEVLSAVTYQAAKALGIDDQKGVIAAGMVADLILWSVKDSSQLCYHFGYPLSHARMVSGEWVFHGE